MHRVRAVSRRSSIGNPSRRRSIFLAGNHAPVVRMLEEKMNQASEEMEFEKAIEYRDLIRSIHQVSERQKITNEDGEDKDVIALAVDDADDTVANADAVVQVFFIRGGKMIGREHLFPACGASGWQIRDPEQLCEAVLCRDAVCAEGADAGDGHRRS